MTVSEMKKLHGGSGIAICSPSVRDKRTGFAEGWDFLGLVQDVGEVADAVARYESLGFVNAVPIALSEDVEIAGAVCAKYFRVLFDQNYLMRSIVFGVGGDACGSEG